MLGHAGSEGPTGCLGAGMAKGWARKARRTELPDCLAVLGGSNTEIPNYLERA